MAGVRKNPRNGKYQGWYNDRNRKLKFFTGTRKKSETRRIAEEIESRENKIRLGYLKPPDVPARQTSKASHEVLQEYLDWGRYQGGRGGRPWGKTHAKERRSKTTWWLERLNLSTMEDFDGILPEAEAALRELQNGGCRSDGRILSGKTINNYIENLRSFCNWAVKRGYLNPLFTAQLQELRRFSI